MHAIIEHHLPAGGQALLEIIDAEAIGDEGFTWRGSSTEEGFVINRGVHDWLR